MSQFILKAINAILHFQFKNQNRPLKDMRTKHNVCHGFSVSTGAKFPLVPAESAPVVIANIELGVIWRDERDTQ